MKRLREDLQRLIGPALAAQEPRRLLELMQDSFERVEDTAYRLYSSAIDEISFDVDRIESTLRRYFSQVLFFDPQQRSASQDTRRLHIICKK